MGRFQMPNTALKWMLAGTFLILLAITTVLVIELTLPRPKFSRRRLPGTDDRIIGDILKNYYDGKFQDEYTKLHENLQSLWRSWSIEERSIFFREQGGEIACVRKILQYLESQSIAKHIWDPPAQKAALTKLLKRLKDPDVVAEMFTNYGFSRDVRKSLQRLS